MKKCSYNASVSRMGSCLSQVNIYLVHVRIHVLQLLDGGVGRAVPLLYVLLEIVLPAGLESADRTRVRGRLHNSIN